MHADHATIEIVGHAMIAFLFLFRGLGAAFELDRHLGRLRARRVPFPKPALGCGLAAMVIGGVMVGLDYHARIGAVVLIAFTLAANLIYHHFWAMQEAQKRQTHLYFFCNNIAVIGGLLLVAA